MVPPQRLLLENEEQNKDGKIKNLLTIIDIVLKTQTVQLFWK